MYYVQNSHPAIISREAFHKVQEELARRKNRTPLSSKTAITSTGKYSRYALTDVLICGECGSRYKRVTWTIKGQKRIVWRCINCGFTFEGTEPPKVCPACLHPQSYYEIRGENW